MDATHCLQARLRNWVPVAILAFLGSLALGYVAIALAPNSVGERWIAVGRPLGALFAAARPPRTWITSATGGPTMTPQSISGAIVTWTVLFALLYGMIRFVKRRRVAI